MSEKVKGVYTNGREMVVVTSYCGGALGCAVVSKGNGGYQRIGEATLGSEDFYSNYELCGYCEEL